MQRVPGPRTRQIPTAPSRDRLTHYDQGGTDFGALGFVVVLAIALFFLVLAVSVRQSTERNEALGLLEQGIATLTEIDLVLAEHRDELQQLVEATDDETVALPGYPLDARLTRDEALNSSDEELRALILGRSALLVYEEGISAFDQTGAQSLGLLSSERLLETVVGQLSETTNRRAEIASYVLLAVVTLAALAVVVRSQGLRAVRNLGIGALAAGVAGVLCVLVAQFLARRIGGNDPFVEELRAIFDDLAAVPQRNYLITAVLGAFLVVLSPLLTLLSRMVPALAGGQAANFVPGETADAWGGHGADDGAEDYEEAADFDEFEEDAEFEDADFEDEADFDDPDEGWEVRARPRGDDDDFEAPRFG